MARRTAARTLARGLSTRPSRVRRRACLRKQLRGSRRRLPTFSAHRHRTPQASRGRLRGSNSPRQRRRRRARWSSMKSITIRWNSPRSTRQGIRFFRARRRRRISPRSSTNSLSFATQPPRPSPSRAGGSITASILLSPAARPLPLAATSSLRKIPRACRRCMPGLRACSGHSPVN